MINKYYIYIKNIKENLWQSTNQLKNARSALMN